MTRTTSRKRSPYAPVPETDHIARYCNPQRVIRHPITDEVEGVYPQAFELRPKIKETYLSTDWMECPKLSAGDVDDQFRAVIAAVRRRLKVKDSAALARLNVGRVLEAGLRRGLSIRVFCRSKRDDPGYTGVYGMPPDNSDTVFLAQLANECCVEVRAVADC
jgi:hypothetical protein